VLVEPSSCLECMMKMMKKKALEIHTSQWIIAAAAAACGD